MEPSAIWTRRLQLPACCFRHGVVPRQRFDTETRRHGDQTEKTERATAPRSGAPTTKEPTKIQAIDIQALYFVVGSFVVSGGRLCRQRSHALNALLRSCSVARLLRC